MLARCVKELVFDGSQFGIGVTKRQYFDDLCLQIEETFNFILSKSLPVDSGDPEVDALANTIRTRTSEAMFEDYEELWTLCGKSKFVDEGYRKWRNLAENQLTRMGDARTLRSFSEALTKLCKHITLIRVVFSWIIGSASLCLKALTYCYIVSHHGNLKLTSSYLRQP